MSERRMSKRKWLAGCTGFVVVLLVGAGVWLGPTLMSFYKGGFFDTVGTHAYNPTVTGNLKAIRTALMLYHDSEGAFPAANGWMDAIRTRIRTDDLSGGEAEKKLIDPAFIGQPGKYGYAMNDAVSGKYKDDIKDPKTPLVFQSSDPSRNAHGSPKVLAPNPPRTGGNLAITVDGSIVRL